jgi:hypothetical protein
VSIEFLTFASDTTGHGVRPQLRAVRRHADDGAAGADRKPNPDALGVDVLEKDEVERAGPADRPVHRRDQLRRKPSVGSSSVAVTSFETPGATTSGPPYSQTFWSVWRTRRAIGAVASLQMSSNGWS